MFDHLAPKHKAYDIKKVTNYKVYISFLFVALIIFTLSLNVNKGLQVGAFDEQIQAVSVIANTKDVSVVTTTPKVTVFNFTINTPVEGINLNQLNIYANGLYDPELLYDLKLYHHGVQLGNVEEVDEYGNIYFAIGEYPLLAGQNEFSLVLSVDDSIAQDDILQFSIEEASDIVLSYNTHPYTPDGEYPVLGGLVSFTDTGSVNAYNTLNLSNPYIIADKAYRIGSFYLRNNYETVDLKNVIITYQADHQPDLSEQVFVLLRDDKIIAQADPVEGSNILEFEFVKSLVVKAGNRIKLQLYMSALPEGEYSFFLDSVIGKGYVSGQDIELVDQLFLSEIRVVPYYLEFRNGNLDVALVDGWNKLYDMNLYAKGVEEIKVTKLSWDLNYAKVDIVKAELWVDKKLHSTDLTITEDKIVADLEQSVLVDIDGTNVQLLIKTFGSFNAFSTLGAYLLTDTEEYSEDSNIIWSVEDDINNSYLLPYLPLEPSILTIQED